MQVANLLLALVQQLHYLLMVLNLARIRCGLQRKESFLCSEKTLRQLSREINQAMKLLTEALLKRHLTLLLIHSGKPQREDAPIVSMLFDLSIPLSRGSIARA